MNNRKETNAKGKKSREFSQQIIVEPIDRVTKRNGVEIKIAAGTRTVITHKNFIS